MGLFSTRGSRLASSKTRTAEKQNAKLLKAWRFVLFVVPAKGVEPSTFALQVLFILFVVVFECELIFKYKYKSKN